MSSDGAPARGRREWLFFGVGVVAFALAIFREVLLPGRLLFTTDDGIGALALRQRVLPSGMFGAWDDSVLIGMAQILNFNWTNLWLSALPLNFFLNWIHALDLLAASLFLALYLRNQGLRWPAVALGALAAFWLGSNFTLTHAGHIGKFGLLVFASAYLWLSDLAVTRRSWAWAMLAGGAMGFMFLEQADVALFCALLLGPATLAHAWRHHARDVKALASILLPLGVTAGLIAFHAVWSGYQSSVKDIASVQQENAKSKWEFATQWSWPPEECIDFIAPGYMGWRSGEPSGPYWGRMGRSAGWETTRQGFMNFKLENHYLGMIPVAFALWAVALARRGNDAARRFTVLAWAAITGLALLLAFGKHFPLYRLLYALPGIASIRNPNKFLHIFQIGLGVLAAFGFDLALRDPAGSRKLRLVLLGAGCVFLLWGLGLFSGISGTVAKLSSAGWGPAAQTIAFNKALALTHAAVLALLFAGLLFGIEKRPALASLGWVVVAMVAVDSALLARHYISSVSADSVQDNDVITILKSDGTGGRVALAAQDNFYNYWLTYLFPYHAIETFNFTQMPRMPSDYQALLQAVGRNPIRLWQAAAVKFVLGPAQLWGQIENDPRMKGQFRLRYAYNVHVRPDNVIEAVAATAERPGQHCVLEYLNAPRRYALVGRWRSGTMEEALDHLQRADVKIGDEVLIHDAPDVAPSAGDAVSGDAGDVVVRSYRSGRVVLGASVARPAVLRVTERFTPEWRAIVNGKPARLFRCDFMMQGLRLDPGLNEVILEYAPPRGTLAALGLGLFLCGVAAFSAFRDGRRHA